MRRRRPSPLGAVARGLAAGVVGTAVMTGYQELAGRAEGSGGGDEGDGTPGWEEAPAPAKVARRISEGVFQHELSPERIPLLANVMHWAYGVGWGAAYGLVQGTVRANPLVAGAAFGAGVWGASYLQLVPMGLYSPPWQYGPKTLATDLSYHVVYGLGVAAGYRTLDRAG